MKRLLIGLLILVITFASGRSFAGDQFEYWEKKGRTYFIQDVPANRAQSTVSRIVLYWVPADSHNMRKDEVVIWEIVPEKPVAFAGLKFQVFDHPSGFILTKAEGKKLPKNGNYYLEIYGYPHWSLLLEDILSADTVLGWKEKK
jgi:hypothetical protein